MNKKLLTCALLSLSLAVTAQQGDGGLPKSGKVVSTLKKADKKFFAEPDVAALKAEDAATEKAGNAPWRFGFNNSTSLNMTNSGTWNTLPNGDRIWQLAITCQNALTVNLTMDQVTLPEGNELYVYNPDKSFILGKFTAYHLYEGTLGTELVPGNTAIVEYYVPARNTGQTASLNIHTVTHGYRTAEEFQQKAFGTSGNCNMNVNCADGALWVDQRNGVVMLVSGSNGFCTGSLINNTANDGKPYVLTANHCYSTPTSWIFRFNWQATGCTNPGTSPTFTSLSGAVLRARRTPSDFCLVEITGGLVNNTVPASFNPFFSGWDNTGAIPTSAVCIHHPDGDIKKISFDDDPLAISQGMGSSEANSTWTLHWDRNTTTEPGSSGSPLFDQNHRIIGQLWGGGASCSNLNSADYYGRLANSWNPSGSTSADHLKTWLDPSNSGATIVDGYNPAGPTHALDAAMSNPQGVSGTICSGTVTPQVTIVNSGTSVLTSATVHYGYDGATNLTYNWTGSLNQYQSSVISLPTATLSAGSHTFKAIVSAPNAGADENDLNDTTVSTFTTVVNGQTVTLNLSMDCYGDEISWVLQDNAGTTTLYSGGPYAQTSGGSTATAAFCLSGGCYKFTITDDYGDGMVSTGCPNGSYTIKDQNNTTLAQLTQANANFGTSHSDNFCITGSSAGLNELAASWKLYPNPASENLTIETAVNGLKTIHVTNAAGQIIRTLESDQQTITIPASTLAKGMYFIQLTSNEGTSQKSFIVQ